MGGDLRSMAVDAEIDGEIDDRPIRSEHLGREPIRSEHLLSSDVSCRQPPANAGKHTRLGGQGAPTPGVKVIMSLNPSTMSATKYCV